MLNEFPTNAQEVMDWEWEQYSPYYEALLARELNWESVASWLTGPNFTICYPK